MSEPTSHIGASERRSSDMLLAVADSDATEALCQPPNKQLQRTVTRRRGDGTSAPFHYALAPRITRQRAAAELRRYAS